MANRLQKLLYFLSAEFPVFIFAAVIWFVQKKEWMVPVILVTLAVTTTVLFFASFHFGRKNLPGITVKIDEISNGEGPLIAYVITYLLPLGSLALRDYYLPVFIAGLIILELFLTFTDYISPHPLLFICRYHFYKVGIQGASKDMILASRKTLRNPDDVTVVQRVFEFLLIREK